jgi:membrane protein implicated in regulation of membrane protease activity
MNPNSALSAWQLAVMAVVPVAALAVWLIAIFLAARQPRGRAQAAAAATETGSGHVVPATVTGEGEPARPADRGIAA